MSNPEGFVNVDKKVYHFAAHWLEVDESHEVIADLAKAIQYAIEAWEMIRKSKALILLIVPYLLISS